MDQCLCGIRGISLRALTSEVKPQGTHGTTQGAHGSILALLAPSSRSWRLYFSGMSIQMSGLRPRGWVLATLVTKMSVLRTWLSGVKPFVYADYSATRLVIRKEFRGKWSMLKNTNAGDLMYLRMRRSVRKM